MVRKFICLESLGLLHIILSSCHSLATLSSPSTVRLHLKTTIHFLCSTYHWNIFLCQTFFHMCPLFQAKFDFPQGSDWSASTLGHCSQKHNRIQGQKLNNIFSLCYEEIQNYQNCTFWSKNPKFHVFGLLQYITKLQKLFSCQNNVSFLWNLNYTFKSDINTYVFSSFVRTWSVQWVKITHEFDRFLGRVHNIEIFQLRGIPPFLLCSWARIQILYGKLNWNAPHVCG